MKSHEWEIDRDFNEGTGFVCRDCNMAVLVYGKDADASDTADEMMVEHDRDGCPYWD